MCQTRETVRKRLIRQILEGLGGDAIYLEELRWRVRLQEPDCRFALGNLRMTTSYEKSFNRSLRSFLPELAPDLRLHKISSANGRTAGLLARVAVYRLQDHQLLDKFLSSESASLHFWTNARTVDIWQESDSGHPGEIDIFHEELLPDNAPERIEPLWFTRGGWPCSGPGRQDDLAAMGPKWKKRPLVCVRICTRATASPSEADVLAIIRIPKNRPLCVIGPEMLNAGSLDDLPRASCEFFLRRRGSTRAIPARQRIG
jgi:hypothetical protein